MRLLDSLALICTEICLIAVSRGALIKLFVKSTCFAMYYISFIATVHFGSMYF